MLLFQLPREMKAQLIKLKQWYWAVLIPLWAVVHSRRREGRLRLRDGDGFCPVPPTPGHGIMEWFGKVAEIWFNSTPLPPSNRPGCSSVSFLCIGLVWGLYFVVIFFCCYIFVLFFVLFLVWSRESQMVKKKKPQRPTQNSQCPKSHHPPWQCKLLGCLLVDHLILMCITSFWKQFKAPGSKNLWQTTLKARQAFLQIEELGENPVSATSISPLEAFPEWQNLPPKTELWLQLG